jgi:RimJ/RimL family protein N-acetyltransferase
MKADALHSIKSTKIYDCPVDHPALPGLYNTHIPNNPPLWAAFQGRHTGRAVVDDMLSPTQCVLRTDMCLTFASTKVSQHFLAESIHLFRQAGQVWLVRCLGDTPAPACDRICSRLEFYECDPRSLAHNKMLRSIPEDFHLQTIDQALLARCEWRDDMVFYCGSLENFLQNGLGICLMHGDEIIVEAYASALGAPYAEIGAITHAAYRGNGYAPATVAYLIQLLKQRGYQAYWSCDTDNAASARVARKLGFRIEKPYEIWEYDAINPKQQDG